MAAQTEDPALEAALDALFAAPFPEFVDERKRLVGGLRAAGHKAAAQALAKVNRPTLASWAINQLVRRAPMEVSEMFASAARVRLGDFAASAEHRQTLAKLSALATDILRAHGQPMSEATLRRIATSLAALSAYGDFAPDLPGRMIADRDPPGFDAMALGDGSAGAGLPLTLPPAAPALRVVPVAAEQGPTATAGPSATGATTAPPTAAAATTAGVARGVAKGAGGDPAAALLAQLAASASLPAAKDATTTTSPLASGADAGARATATKKPDASRPAATSKAGESAAAKSTAPAAREAATTPILRLVPPPVAESAVDAVDATDEATAADAEAAAAAEAAERAVAEAAAALAAAQAAAKAAAARVHLQRQRAVLEELRQRQRRAATSIYDHEQAILLMQRELEQRQALLHTARHDAEALQVEIDRVAAEVEQLTKPS